MTQYPSLVGLLVAFAECLLAAGVVALSIAVLIGRGHEE